MNPKRIIIVGTMAFAITFGAGSLAPADRANASAKTNHANALDPNVVVKDDFQEALGVSSDEEVYDALYSGQSLADIAQSHQADVQDVIDLQVAQLSEQLDNRLANGSITPQVYDEQKSEITAIITNSAYGGG